VFEKGTSPARYGQPKNLAYMRSGCPSAVVNMHNLIDSAPIGE